jgi:hypothetical protein
MSLHSLCRDRCCFLLPGISHREDVSCDAAQRGRCHWDALCAAAVVTRGVQTGRVRPDPYMHHYNHRHLDKHRIIFSALFSSSQLTTTFLVLIISLSFSVRGLALSRADTDLRLRFRMKNHTDPQRRIVTQVPVLPVVSPSFLSFFPSLHNLASWRCTGLPPFSCS